MRQQILFLYLENSSLDSKVISWGFWDGTGKTQSYAGDSDLPPYETGFDAMLDGWFLIQASPLLTAASGNEYKTSFFQNEFIFEKTVSPPDNFIENFFCSDFNELIIFFKFLLLKDSLFPLPEIK